MKIDYYKDFETFDFIEDANFRRWVLENDKSLNFFWEAYLRKYPFRQESLLEAKYLLTGTQSFYSSEVENVSQLDNSFRSHLSSVHQSSSAKLRELHEVQTKRRLKRRYLLTAVVGTIALLILGLVLWLSNSNKVITYATCNGEWETIELPDGSSVELNANSELSVFSNWTEGEDRRVWLQGEAFFDVEKKESTGAKFFVTTTDLTVEVLGTAFSVNTRNSQTEVFLEEGHISLDLNGAEEKESIVPGEFIAYSEVQGKVTHRYKKTEEIQANWKEGVVKLDNVSTAEIISEIEAIYGMKVIVNSKSVLSKVSSVAIPVDSIDMAIAILRRALNIRISHTKDRVYIG